MASLGEAIVRFAPAVAALLKDGDPTVRGAAAWALGAMGAAGAPVAPAVVALLKDGDPTAADTPR
jgi:HEAT repeat protein